MVEMQAEVNALRASTSSSSAPKPVFGRPPRKDRIDGLTPEVIKKLQAEGKCFRCKEPGHMKNECPKKPKNA
jgi:hypothetical protein